MVFVGLFVLGLGNGTAERADTTNSIIIMNTINYFLLLIILQYCSKH